MENQTLGSRIKAARKRAGLTQPELGRVFGISREAVSLWESDTNAPTVDKIGRIATETHTSAEWLMTGRGEMDGQQAAMPTLPSGEPAPRLGRIPVLGMGAGGSDGLYEWNGEEIDRVDRPPFLADAIGAYAIYCSGTSMVPRYEDGELLFVHPGRPITPGSYVVVQFHLDEGGGAPKVWIKQFVERKATKTLLRQLNPAKPLELSTRRIVAVHRVVGTGER